MLNRYAGPSRYERHPVLPLKALRPEIGRSDAVDWAITVCGSVALLGAVASWAYVLFRLVRSLLIATH